MDLSHVPGLGRLLQSLAPAPALALTGDYSIFREAAGGEAVTATPFDVTWDTVETESANIDLQGDDSTIDLAEGGKYLVLYNVWTHKGTSTGADRRSFATNLTLDGVDLEYGRSAGYFRDASGEDEAAYAAGSAIISANSGDDLQVQIERDDTNPSAESLIRDGANGVSVLKLNDNFDYLRIHQSTRSSDISGNISFTDVVFDTADEVDTGSFGFTASSTATDITLKGDAGDKFLITANVRLEDDSGSDTRQNYETRLVLDGVEIEGSRTTAYLRGDANSHGTTKSTAVYSGIVEKRSNSDEILNVELRRESVTGVSTDIVADATALSAVALPDTADYVMLTATSSSQTLAVSQTPFTWNRQLDVSGSSFSHSTTTNNSRIDFDTSGDFLFFSTAYTERSSDTDRNVPRIQWRLDGSSVVSYGGHGSYNRGDQGTDDAYTSGSSGGLLLSDITSGQYLELLHSDETGDAPNAVFPEGRIALQGVDLASLAQIETTVSAETIQTATTSPGTTNFETGASFVITANSGSRNITNLVLSESGTIDAASDVSNVELYYDMDTTAPYDCTSEDRDGDESQFGATDTGGFTGADGTVSFTDNVSISTTNTFCAYLELDVGSGAVDGQTLNVNIADPTGDVVVSNGSVGPSAAVGDSSATTIVDPEVTMAHYHWRNDDGSETDATSATGGSEDTPALNFSTSTPQRLRVSLYAPGTGEATMNFRLEYAQKSGGSCSAATGWTDVAAGGGDWDMFDTSNFNNGDDTTNIPIADGGVSDPHSFFLTDSNGLLDTTSESDPITLTDGDFESVGEYGTVTNTNGATSTVNLTNTYTDPVVVASVRYNRNTELFRTARVTKKTSTSFDILTSDIGDDAGGDTVVDYLVLEAGTWDIQDGESTRQVIATTTENVTHVEGGGAYADPGTHTLRSWESSFSTAPAVIATVSSYNSTDWLMAHLSDGTTREALPTATGFGVYLGRSHAATSTYDEDIDVVAFEPGHGTNNGTEYDAVVGPNDEVTHIPTPVEFYEPYTSGPPGVTLVMQGFEDGGNGATALRHTGIAIDSSSTSVALDEDGDPGGDRDHTTEPILMLSFAGSSGQLYTESIVDKDFAELEYSIQATDNSTAGVGYCFRVTDAGTPLRNYDVYAEATLNSDATVSATGTQTTSVDITTTNNYLGGAFVITDNVATRTVDSITISESGSIDASVGIENLELYYELDTSDPYNCVSESYAGIESQYGSTDVNGFSSPNGSSTFTDTVTIGTTSAMCLYTVFDTTDAAANGETIDVEITEPASDVSVSSGSVGPGSVIAITGSTTVNAPDLSQFGYHWRNNDGDETDGAGGATSASGGSENTLLADVQRGSINRVRLGIANEGGASSAATQYRLEYAAKVSSCALIENWQDVDVGAAFTMASTSQLVDGDDTTNIATASGGITDPNAMSFVTPNGGQKEDDSETSALTLASGEFTELEYAITPTDQSGYDTTYCFRVTDAGSELPTYTEYAELTTQEQQDFFIQRGTETVTGTSTTLVAGVDYTAPAASSSAFIRITNSHMTGAGGSAGAQDTADDFTAYIEDPDNLETSVTITRPSTADDDTRVSWEIVEYVGLGGADNEMIVRDVGTVTYGSNDLFATGTAATSVVDDDDVVVFITGQQNPDTGIENYNTGLSLSSWHATNSVPVFERGDADGVAAPLSYAVVEFTGANWRVQRAEHVYQNAGVTETEPITAVTSVTRTFLHTQKLAGDELYNLDETGHEVWLSSLGAISFELETGSSNPSDQRSVAWVIENAQTGDGHMRVHQSNSTITSGGGEPATFIYNIGATVDTTNSSIWLNHESTGAGDFQPRAFLGARIFSDTQYELYRADNGQNQAFRTQVVEWPVAELSIRQNYYRLYVDNDALTPTDPWPVGASDLGENAAMTDLDEPLGEGERVRVRMTLFINNASLVADSKNFKLQFARRDTTCSAISSWTDVGDPGSGEIWRGFDASPADGTEVSSTSLRITSVADVAGTYEESNDSAVNPNAVEPGEDVEYDWNIENNGALQKSSYCFRMVEADGTTLDGYDNYPTVRTSGYTPITDTWRWYDDEENETPTVALGGEEVTPTDIALGDIIKLRVLTAEIEGAAGSNIKFNLQYSEDPNFADGGTTLTATSSCTGGTGWCYADGVDSDNDIISTTTLTGADSCIAGVGDGCGVHNEAAGLTSPFTHEAFAVAEQEFTLQHDGARANAVYYFRLVDATNGSPVLASSSYPSVVTEGAELTFTVSGLPSGTSTEGIVTDATSTVDSIAFGTILPNTEYEAAQRISVTTNATEGYQILKYATQELVNQYAEPIPGVAGTNASPQSWVGGCVATATGCFGYHPGDDVLFGGSARFAPDDSYAALDTEPQEIMQSSIPTSDETDIVYKLEISDLQAAGDYVTDILYIAVPVF